MNSVYSPYRHSRLERRSIQNPNSVASPKFSRKGTYLFATVLRRNYGFCVLC